MYRDKVGDQDQKQNSAESDHTSIGLLCSENSSKMGVIPLLITAHGNFVVVVVLNLSTPFLRKPPRQFTST